MAKQVPGGGAKIPSPGWKIFKHNIYQSDLTVKLIRSMLNNMNSKATAFTAEDFVMAISMVVRRVRADAPRELRDFTWTQKAVLSRLEKGPATSAQLARAEGVKPQSMGVALALLEKMGLVERSPHPTDGRQINIKLAAKGIALRKRVREAKETWAAQALAKLDKRELAILFNATEVIKRMLEL